MPRPGGDERVSIRGATTGAARRRRRRHHHRHHHHRRRLPLPAQRVVYIYKAPTKKNASRFRSIWGRISRPHGTNGAVRAKFRVNLPAKSLGGPVHVMLYPSQV